MKRKWELPFAVKYHGGTHGGDPENPEIKTTLFAAGRGIKEGVILDDINITQVAMLIAELLDLTLKSDATPPEELFSNTNQ